MKRGRMCASGWWMWCDGTMAVMRRTERVDDAERKGEVRREVCKEHGGQVSNDRRPRNTGAGHDNGGPRYADAKTPGAPAAVDNLTQRK